MEQERSALENGRHEGDNVYGATRFPAVKVDRVLHDGDHDLRWQRYDDRDAYSRPYEGLYDLVHERKGRRLARQVVFPCSLTVAGPRKLVGNTRPSHDRRGL